MTHVTQLRLLLISKEWYETLKDKLPVINKNCYCIDNEYFNLNYNKCLINSTANQHSFLFKDRSKTVIANTFNLGNNFFGYFMNEYIEISNQIREYIKVKDNIVCKLEKNQ